MSPNQFNDSRIPGLCMAKRNRLSPAKFDRWRVTPQEALQRFAERAAREAADTRTPAQRWLNDPPPGRIGIGASIDSGTWYPNRERFALSDKEFNALLSLLALFT